MVVGGGVKMMIMNKQQFGRVKQLNIQESERKRNKNQQVCNSIEIKKMFVFVVHDNDDDGDEVQKLGSSDEMKKDQNQRK